MSNKTVRIADLQDEAPATDEYAPRSRAELQVKWAERRRTTEDAPAPRRAPSNALPIGVGAVLLIALLVAIVHQFSTTPPLRTGGQTEAPARMFQTSSVAPQGGSGTTEAPTAISAAMINAYAAPDGALLGQIEETRQINPVAHYGSGWIQAEVAGSGLVWLRASDFPTLAIVGPDLAPQPAGRGLTNEQGTNNEGPPAATPAPPVDPWPVSAPIVPDPAAPNIKEHFNAPKAPGQEG